MNWQEDLLHIQSYEFDANLNIVSSMGAFFRAAAQEPTVRSLYTRMLQSGDAREEALGRIHDLSMLEVDRRYESPHDTPLAILLWLMQFAAPDLIALAADLVDRAPQCWYAKKLARRILVPPPVGTANSWWSDIERRLDSAVDFSGEIGITANPAWGDVRRFYPTQPTAAAITSGDVGDENNERTATVGDLFIN